METAMTGQQQKPQKGALQPAHKIAGVRCASKLMIDL
jgi:hypothetical protein